MIQWMNILFWALHQTADSPGSPGIFKQFFLSKIEVVCVGNYMLSFIHQILSQKHHVFEVVIFWKRIGFALR